GVGERVDVRGFVPDEELIQLYANALAVCYLPFDEDYGYVTLEAMLSAKPVLVTNDSGGGGGVIEDEHRGLIVEPESGAIAESLDRLYSDRELARCMGERGNNKLRSMNLSWSRVVEQLISAAG